MYLANYFYHILIFDGLGGLRVLHVVGIGNIIYYDFVFKI